VGAAGQAKPKKLEVANRLEGAFRGTKRKGGEQKDADHHEGGIKLFCPHLSKVGYGGANQVIRERGAT